MVETFTQRTVQQSGQVPGYQNVNFLPDAFGAPIGRALEHLGQTGQQIGTMIAQVESEKKANDALDVT